ncbi:MAG: DNA-directed RNA polymerase subunit N [Candidatus Syntropharchaeia archaeon]
MIPIRCFTCGKVIAGVWEEYKERIKKEEPGKVLDDLGIKRYCCRRMLLTHAEIIDSIAPYQWGL